MNRLFFTLVALAAAVAFLIYHCRCIWRYERRKRLEQRS